MQKDQAEYPYRRPSTASFERRPRMEMGHNDVTTTMVYTHVLHEVGSEFGVLQTHCERWRSVQVYS